MFFYEQYWRCDKCTSYYIVHYKVVLIMSTKQNEKKKNVHKLSLHEIYAP